MGVPSRRFIAHTTFAALAATLVLLSLLTISKWRIVRPPPWIDRLLFVGDVDQPWPVSLADVMFVADVKSGEVRELSLSMSADGMFPLVFDPTVRTYQPTLTQTFSMWGLLSFWRFTATYTLRFTPTRSSMESDAVNQDWERVRPHIVKLFVHQGMESSFAQRLCAGPPDQLTSHAVHTTFIGFIIHDLLVVLLAAAGLRSTWIAAKDVRHRRHERLKLARICIGCGYDLSGSPNATACSECGRVI